jgi:hypothetical protein
MATTTRVSAGALATPSELTSPRVDGSPAGACGQRAGVQSPVGQARSMASVIKRVPAGAKGGAGVAHAAGRPAVKKSMKAANCNLAGADVAERGRTAGMVNGT